MPPDTAAAPVRIVDVRRFGARADGVSNDAPAFNAAIEYIRTQQARVGPYPVTHKLLIPCGVYAIGESVDMTRLQGINAVIDGDGSVILGRCRGEPVIDALGSRWLTMRDLTIVGDKEFPPKLGLQIGRLKSGVVADDHRFENVKIVGNYSLTCLLNSAAETSGFDHVLLWNDFPDPASYCLIQDGLDHFGTVSKFVPGQVVTNEKDQSFNENEFINCDFRHGGGGIPVWLGDTGRHRFIRCYAAATGEAAFVLYCGGNSHTMLDIDCHCETEKLKSVFLVAGTRRDPTLRGFKYKDHACFASLTVFRREPQVQTVTLADADIEIAHFSVRGCRVFDDPHAWTVTGRYSSADGAEWNGAGAFTGMLLIGREVVTAGAVGVQAPSGESRRRPAGLGPADVGRIYLDTDLNKLLVWSGRAWLNFGGGKA